MKTVVSFVKTMAWIRTVKPGATQCAPPQQRPCSIPIDPFAANAFRKLPIDAPNLLTHAEVMLQRHESALSDSVRELSPRVSFETVHPIRKGVLVHTDCGPGNIVSSPDGLRLIDWQCPGIGDGLQDVLTFVSPAMQLLYGYPVLTLAEEQRFLGVYFSVLDEHPTDAMETSERLRMTRSSHHYRFAAYCAMRAQDTASSDEKTSRLYSVALQAEIQMLHRLLS